MPSSMTHTYFGIDVFEKLAPKYQVKIMHHLEYFKLFSQGSDPFMFYHFLIGNKAKQSSNVQKQMHQSETQNFFINTIQYIHQHHLTESEEIMAYLYGYICHYFLDLYTHPLIYYKSGIFHKEDKNTYKYNALHQEIEYMIDLYLIKEKETIKPEKFKIYKEIFQVKSFSSTLMKMINQTIQKTYQIPNIANQYLKSIWYMKKCFRYINYDPHGIKLKLYKQIDKISPANMIRLQELSYYNITSKEASTYLNLDHKEWCYPWNKNQKFTTSFLDLYNQAKKDATNTIQEVTDLLEEKKLNIPKLKQLFPNLSFLTGRPCQEKLTFQYFKF